MKEISSSLSFPNLWGNFSFLQFRSPAVPKFDEGGSAPNLWVNFAPRLLALGYRLSLPAPNLRATFACLLLLSPITARAESALITIDAAKPGPALNPRMY